MFDAQGLNQRSAQVVTKGPNIIFHAKEDWYTVPLKTYISSGGKGLIAKYQYNRYALLVAVYPEYDWLPWLFSVAPRRVMSDPIVQLKYMKWLGVRQGFVTPEDWYRVSVDDFKQTGGYGMLQKQ